MRESRSQPRKSGRRQTSRGNRTVGRRGGAGADRKLNRLALGTGRLSALNSSMRLRFSLLFALSVVAGIALARPVEQQIAPWTDNDLGLLETMAIQGNHRLSFGEIANLTEIQRGTPLASVDTSVVAQRLNRQAWIREANVLRLPPSTLLIRVQERRPKAVLLPRDPTPELAHPRLIDADGHLFSASFPSESLPHLIGGEALTSNESHAVLLTAMTLFEHLEAPELADLWSQGHGLEVHLPLQGASEGWALRGTVDVLLGRRDLVARIQQLAQLIHRDEILGAMTGERILIDLRFADQAVLRRAKKLEVNGELKS